MAKSSLPPSSSVCTSDDFVPTASWPVLRLRDALLRKLRGFFHNRGFIEVDTPLLSADVVVDRHLEPFGVEVPCGGQGTRRLWLQTSPEFAMKRLLAAGGEAIFQVTHAFRQEEQGPLHNPEFMMVEWYRRGDGLSEGVQLLGDLADALLGRGPADRISYQAAFERYAEIEPHSATVAALADAARRRDVSVPSGLDDDRDAWLDLLLVELVQPHLGRGRPAIVCDYPASQAALARVRTGPPDVAERFELYIDGLELANGYHELLDADVLRRRNRENNRRRIAAGKRALPEESRLLSAMESGLPACSGAALGFDRVVMLAAQAAQISDVIAFPFDRA